MKGQFCWNKTADFAIKLKTMLRNLIPAFLLSFFLLHAIPASAQTPVETGQVTWKRGVDSALKQAKKSGKPVFVLFQEIPGCVTCRRFGQGPLSNPLLVEAIEDLFEPVLVYNNKPVDKAVLKRFREPSWNNPVVRFLKADGTDLIPRKDGVWTTQGVAQRMVDALKAAKKPVPSYLQFALEENASKTERAVFQMFCYYTGEKGLGAMDGVLSTRSGWANGAEVVEVVYDPDKTSFPKLAQQAFAIKCADSAYVTSQQQLRNVPQSVAKRTRFLGKAKVRDAAPGEDKVYLKRSKLAHLSLTPMQQTKVNAALANRQDPRQYLSPRQLKTLR